MISVCITTKVQPEEEKEMNTHLLITLVALIASFCGETHAAEPKPNIVLIFADDLGWQETGFAGSDFLETPRLDQLAREGMIFRHAYASAGNCQPSRACMLSGQYTCLLYTSPSPRD